MVEVLSMILIISLLLVGALAFAYMIFSRSTDAKKVKICKYIERCGYACLGIAIGQIIAMFFIG